MQRSKNTRRADLAKIHIAKKQLGMDDDAYRAMLEAVGGKRSAADLTPIGRAKVLDYFKRLGFSPRSPRSGPKPRVDAWRRPLIGKIEALLTDAGRPWTYLTGKGAKGWSMLQRITGKQRLEFCTGQDLHKIVAALEYDKRRREERDGGRKA